MVLTYQDYETAVSENNVMQWLRDSLAKYTGSPEYRKAVTEKEYMAGRDTAINDTVKVIYDMTGRAVQDFTASNNRISSNLLHRLISQRVSYSLGNGVSFAGATVDQVKGGRIDPTKDAVGPRFDTKVHRAAYWACGNGESYTFVHKAHDGGGWEYDVFTRLEFMPLYDEYTGKLRGGVRFWSMDWHKKPVIAVLYTEAGYQRFETEKGQTGFGTLRPVSDVMPYVETIAYTEADGEEIVNGGNYSTLPIIPLYANENHVSVLDNLKAKIDALDLVVSGFANDMHDCAQIYWLVNGGNGMSENDKKELRDRLLLQHMAVIDEQHSSITPYTQEPPYQAREIFIQRMIDRIYSDFGALNVMQISDQQRTATEINAAYQPMDEEADMFEYQLIEYIQQILSIMGLEDMPLFKRNRITNQKEQTDMIMSCADLLDRETILEKLPFITVDEVPTILARMDAEAVKSMPTDEDVETELNAQEQEEAIANE